MSDLIKRFATGCMQSGMTSQFCGQFIYLLVQSVYNKLQKSVSFKQSLDNEKIPKDIIKQEPYFE